MEALRSILSRENATVHTCKEFSEREYVQGQVDAMNNLPGDQKNDDGYDCKICKNKEVVFFVKEDADGGFSCSSHTCKCVETRRSIRRMQRSGLKNIIKDYTFAKYEATEPWQKSIKDAAVRYAQNPNGWFFIGGQSGAGKTHICTSICREFLLAGNAVAYMLWRDDAAKLKGLVTDYELQEPLMKRFKETKVLYVDDLFKTGKGTDGKKQLPTPADIGIAFEILNYRYNNPDLLTIISSELTAGELIEIDEAVGGRIYEKSVVLNLAPDPSRNYRLRKAVTI